MVVANVEVDLPAGFRFDPSDRELIECYLTKKILNLPLPTHVTPQFPVLKISLNKSHKSEYFSKGVSHFILKTT